MSSRNSTSPVSQATPAEKTTEALVKTLNNLLASTVLSLASLLPGPAGYAGATGAIAFDLSWRYWTGVLLSGLSMIPFAGYLPAALKVGILLVRVDRHLSKIEAFLPEIQQSPELLAQVHEGVSKYAGKLAKFRKAAGVGAKLQRILEQTAGAQPETSNSSITTIQE